ACVAGDAELTLTLKQGRPSETGTARMIEATRSQLPKPLDGASLAVTEEDESLALVLTLPEGSPIDPATADVFPATPGTIDSAAVIRFEKSGETWTANAPKSEYAKSPLEKLVLVIASKDATPVKVSWQAE